MRSIFFNATKILATFLVITAWLSISRQPAMAAEDHAPQTVLIGFAGDLKAGALRLGTLALSARDGSQLAVDEANQSHPHVGGKPVVFKLLAVDDKSDPNFAVPAANYLIRSGVVAVIGHNGTDTSLATGKLYDQAGIPQVPPLATGRKLTEMGSSTIFQLLGGSDVTSQHLTEVVRQIIPSTRIAVIDNDTLVGAGLAAAFIKNLKEQGLDVIFKDSINPKLTGFNSLMARIKAQQVDFIFFTGTGEQATTFSRSIQQSNSTAKLLIIGGAVNAEFPNAGSYGNGTLILLHGLPAEKLPGYKAFEKKYREKFDTPISAYTLFAYDAVGIVVAAIKESNSLNPQTITSALHKIQYKGLSGPVSFDAEGRQNNPPYTLYQVAQGKWQPIKTFGGASR